MIIEYDSLIKNKTWNFVPFPPTQNSIDCKWLYKTMFIVEGHIEKHKARLLEKGFINKKVLIIMKPLLQFIK